MAGMTGREDNRRHIADSLNETADSAPALPIG